jgi:hypothetical protein
MVRPAAAGPQIPPFGVCSPLQRQHASPPTWSWRMQEAQPMINLRTVAVKRQPGWMLASFDMEGHR